MTKVRTVACLLYADGATRRSLYGVYHAQIRQTRRGPYWNIHEARQVGTVERVADGPTNYARIAAPFATPAAPLWEVYRQ